MSFTLGLASSRDDLLDACAVRADSYGRHLPELRQHLIEPDPLDLCEGTAVFLSRDKVSGLATGTMRIQTSHFGALRMEDSLALPGWLTGAPRVEITRLAVRVGSDPLTKLCLMKASYLYCVAQQMHWMVIGARNEALIRNYRRLGFRDVLGQGEQVPLLHTGGLLHRILAFDVMAAKSAWAAAKHPLYGFMIDTLHEDLHLDPVETGRSRQPAPGTPSSMIMPA